MKPAGLTDREIGALDSYVFLLRERFGVKLVEVVLFGSVATGDATPVSDIDIAVLLDRPTAKDLADARGLGSMSGCRIGYCCRSVRWPARLEGLGRYAPSLPPKPAPRRHLLT